MHILLVIEILVGLDLGSVTSMLLAFVEVYQLAHIRQFLF